jgi:hypothetical protein
MCTRLAVYMPWKNCTMLTWSSNASRPEGGCHGRLQQSHTQRHLFLSI